jgi:hypothetical protein
VLGINCDDIRYYGSEDDGGYGKYGGGNDFIFKANSLRKGIKCWEEIRAPLYLF